MPARYPTPRKGILTLIALLAVVTMTLAARPASATSGSASGQLTQVEFNAGNPSWPYVILQMNSTGGTNYYGQQPSPGCSIPANSADTIKAFHSLAQAAFLTGKTVTVYYNVCWGFNYIYDVTVQR
jgi:hypothetical protein